MNKSKIRDQLVHQLQIELTALEKIALRAHEAATHEELQPDGKYDTQAIEASYLAGAQIRRVQEIRINLAQVEALPLQESSTISIGSLFEVKKLGWYFLAPTNSKTALLIDGLTIKVLSAASPIGQELLGLSTGESTEIQTPSGIKEFTILKIQ